MENDNRILDPSGYIKIKDPRRDRYSWEHRVIMENHLGRLLTEDEHIHHINGVKTDNRVENLELHSNSDHRKLHWDNTPSEEKSEKMSLMRAKAIESRRRNLIKRLDESEEIYCACGCGEKLTSCDLRGRPRKYIHGHNKGKLGWRKKDAKD
ncbi:MAG: HNH endonuclease [Dehalococcoidia bacterium]|jgi:hypothetical protein